MVAMEPGTVRVIADCGPTAPVFRDNGASTRASTPQTGAAATPVAVVRQQVCTTCVSPAQPIAPVCVMSDKPAALLCTEQKKASASSKHPVDDSRMRGHDTCLMFPTAQLVVTAGESRIREVKHDDAVAGKGPG